MLQLKFKLASDTIVTLEKKKTARIQKTDAKSHSAED